jgi:conserved hypothetical integral membrane protein
MLIRFINYIGEITVQTCNTTGRFVLFFVMTLRALFTTRLKMTLVITQIQLIGVNSFVIIFLTGISTGLVLALQTYIGFQRFGITDFVGTVVALSMTRELGPVLTGLMVAGRAGSAMAAELGTMNITEQIDALRTLCINPYQYLIVPRIIASTFVLPFLTTFSMIAGVAGGYICAIYFLDLNPDSYITGIQEYVELSDITGGLIKSSFFGLILSWVGSYNGFYTIGGARGVGFSTTSSVVAGSIMILIANYFLTSLLFQSGIS